MRSIFVNLKEHASLIVFLSKSTLQNAVKYIQKYIRNLIASTICIMDPHVQRKYRGFLRTIILYPLQVFYKKLVYKILKELIVSNFVFF